jgi:hypothetical protein
MADLSRRHILAGAAATVAAAALPAVAIYDATIGFLVAGELSDADVGDIHFDQESMDFFEMTERGWVLLPKDAS